MKIIKKNPFLNLFPPKVDFDQPCSPFFTTRHRFRSQLSTEPINLLGIIFYMEKNYIIIE